MVMRSVKQLGSRFLVAAVLTVMLVSTFSSSAFAATELAYDDNGAEMGATTAPPLYFAVEFSLPSGWSTGRLLKARYNIYADPTTFRVHIYGSDGTTELLIPSLVVTPSATGWFDVDLTAYNIIISADFYVAMEFQTVNQPRIGYDTLPAPSAGRSYVGTPGSWISMTDGDLMIRAVVEQILAPRPVGGVLVPVNKLVLLSPYLAILGLVGAVTVAVAIQRRWKN